MGSISKAFSLLLVVLLAASILIMVNPALAQSILKPSVPEFTVKLISSLPEANKSKIELTIKNQPFDNNIYHYSFVYNVRIKTNDENWTDLYDPEDGYPTQSTSDYTVLSYVLGESAYYPSADYPLSPSMRVGILPSYGQVDFQVQAMIGYRDRGVYSNGIMPYVFKGETSGWSNTQTITIPETSLIPTATPFLPPRNPLHLSLLDYLIAVSIGIVVILPLLTILLLYRRHRKTQVSNSLPP